MLLARRLGKLEVMVDLRAVRNIRLLYSYCMNFLDYKTLALIRALRDES